MIPLLAQDPGKLLPAPPVAGDTVTWIATILVGVLVLCLVVGVPLLWRAAREERTEMIEAWRAEGKEWRAEIAAERAHDRERANVIHARLDGIKDKLSDIAR